MIKALQNILWNPDTATGTAVVTGDRTQVSGTGDVESRILTAEDLFRWDNHYIQAILPAGASVSALFSVSGDCIKWSAWNDMAELPPLPFIKVKLILVDAELSWMRLYYLNSAPGGGQSFGERMIGELPPGLMYDRYKNGGISNGELRALGTILDRHESLILDLQNQFSPHRATWGLSLWEESLSLPVNPGYDLQTRRNLVLARIRAKRGINRQIFENLLEAYGYTATIHEYYVDVFKAGQGRAGDPIYAPEAALCWEVIITDETAFIKQFRVGQSHSGDALYAYDDFGEIETLFQKLKPSHTWVGFLYQ